MSNRGLCSALIKFQPLLMRCAGHRIPLLSTTARGTALPPYFSTGRRLMASSQRQHNAANGAEGPPVLNVDITRENFSAMLPVVQEALDKCMFYSFDCEMTGLFLENNKHEYLDDMQDRHAKFVESSRAFVINQYGLSAFERTGPNTYVARTFNFYLFPQPFESYNRRFVCEAASLAFLASQGFDFNKCIYHGVPFMPMRTLTYRLTQLERFSEPRANPATATRPEDVTYVQELVSSIQAWMAGGTRDEFELEMSFNGFRRMLVYQELEKAQFGVEGTLASTWTEPRRWGERSGAPRVTLRRVSAEEATRLEAEAVEARAAALREAAGFAQVFDMMRASGKPGVGHNCMFDVAYALQGFAVGDLPARWSEFKALAAHWHPGGLFDTKYLARQLPEVFGGDTSLGDVFRALVHGDRAVVTGELLQLAAGSQLADEDGTAAQPQLPTIEHAPGFEKYREVEAGALAHEAGYDAYMTGAAFACLLPLIEAKARTDPAGEVAQARAAAAAAAATAATARGSDAGANGDGAAANGNGASSSDAAAGMTVGSAPDPAPESAADAEVDGYAAASPSTAGAAGAVGRGASSSSDPLEWVRALVGRLNLGRSDMPYAALSGDDPVLERPFVFHLSGMQAGWRVGDVQRWASDAGVGKPRVTVLDATSVLIEVEPDQAPGALSKLQSSQDFTAVPWAEYSAQKHAAVAAQDAARQQLWQEQQQQRRERRQQQQEQQQKQAVDGDGVAVGAKRSRAGDDAVDVDDNKEAAVDVQQGRSSCAIM